MMKRVLVVLLIVSLLVLCGCGTSGKKQDTTNGPANSGATQPGTSDVTTGDQSAVTDPSIDWETPIDIDDSFDEIEGGEVTDPSDPVDPSDPTEVPDPSDPTDPQVTDPQPTDPKPTTPPATGGSKDGPIELPMIPG